MSLFDHSRHRICLLLLKKKKVPGPKKPSLKKRKAGDKSLKDKVSHTKDWVKEIKWMLFTFHEDEAHWCLIVNLVNEFQRIPATAVPGSCTAENPQVYLSLTGSIKDPTRKRMLKPNPFFLKKLLGQFPSFVKSWISQWGIDGWPERHVFSTL